jgi:hypothetical protein
MAMAGLAGAGEHGSTAQTGIRGSYRRRSPRLRVLCPSKRRTRRYDWCSLLGIQPLKRVSVACYTGRDADMPGAPICCLQDTARRRYRIVYVHGVRREVMRNMQLVLLRVKKEEKDFERFTNSCFILGRTAHMAMADCRAGQCTGSRGQKKTRTARVEHRLPEQKRSRIGAARPHSLGNLRRRREGVSPRQRLRRIPSAAMRLRFL